jgi:hypothetical protein
MLIEGINPSFPRFSLAFSRITNFSSYKSIFEKRVLKAITYRLSLSFRSSSVFIFSLIVVDESKVDKMSKYYSLVEPS